MAIKGYYDNPDEATSVNEGDYLGIQQGTTLADMKKVKKQTLFKPTVDLINELRLRVGDMAKGVRWQENITSIVDSPPATPEENSRYIVGENATGIFVGHENEIATYNTTWTFEIPQDTWGVFVYNTTKIYIYRNGSWLYFGDFGHITDVMHQTEQARDDVLNNTGFIVVSSDLLGVDSIGKVAGNKINIDKVADNEASINAVADNETNINSVNANKANINAVHNNATNINAVALNKANIDKVAETKVNIDAVALNKPNIDAVAGNELNINAVKNNQTNINAVNANKANIDKVAGTKVNIDAVADNKVNIDKVASIDTQITTLAPIKDDIVTVAGKETEVTALGARTAEIDTLYAQLSTIAEKENLSNKKSTLVENSEVYYPNQKAVNDGLDTKTSKSQIAYDNDSDTFIANTLASGAIIERGSNANGSYIKFADGTLICFHGFNLGSVAIGVDFISLWVLPSQSYIGNVIIEGTASGYAGSRLSVGVNKSNIPSSVVFGVTSVDGTVYDTTGTTFIEFMAIGRWK